MQNTLSNNPLVYILILNWNSYQETIECITSCKTLSYDNFNLVIIDNGSKDDSEKKLSLHFPEIPLIQTGKNLGYSGGNNIGIRYALKKGANYIWIINPDLLVEKDSLRKMIGVMRNNPTIGICGSRVIHGKQPKGFAFDGLTIETEAGYQWRFNIVDLLSKKNRSGIIDVDSVSGCSMLIKSEVFSCIGLLREQFFLYYEDVEFSFRARDYGWRTVINTESIVTHDYNVEVESQATGFRVERSRILFARLRKGNMGKSLITKQSVNLLRSDLKQMKVGRFFRILIEILVGIICGLIQQEKPLQFISNADNYL